MRRAGPAILAGTLLLALAPAAAGAAAAPAAGDSLRLALDEAVTRALEHGEEMRTARAFVSQTAGLVREETSRALPQISGSLTYTRQLSSIWEGTETDTSGLGDLLAASPFAAENAWTAELYGEQLLLSGGKFSAALRAAKAANRSAQASERETAGDVAFDVTRAYYNAAYARRLVEIARASLESAREHLRQVQAGRREGSRSEFDVLRAEVDAANQEPALIEAGRGVDLAMLALKRLINMPIDQPVALATPLAFTDDLVPVVLEDTLSVAQRPALAAADAEVEARAQAVKVYRGQHWPDLYLSSTYQQQAFPGDVTPRWDEFRATGTCRCASRCPCSPASARGPGAAGAGRPGRRASRPCPHPRARASSRPTRRAPSSTAASPRCWPGATTVRQARRAFELANVRYLNGMSTQVEVSDARLQLQTAEVNEVSAIRDYLVSLARLERAIGRPAPVDAPAAGGGDQAPRSGKGTLMETRRAMRAVAILLAAAALAGCGNSAARRDGARDESVARLAQRDVATATRADLATGVAVQGVLEPAVDVRIIAPFAEVLDEVLVKEGQAVRRGQVLARFRDDLDRPRRGQRRGGRAEVAAADHERMQNLLPGGCGLAARRRERRGAARAAEAQARTWPRSTSTTPRCARPVAGVDRQAHRAEPATASATATRCSGSSTPRELEFEATVPSEALGGVRPGRARGAHRQRPRRATVAGRVARVNATVDQATRQVKVYVARAEPRRAALVGGHVRQRPHRAARRRRASLAVPARGRAAEADGSGLRGLGDRRRPARAAAPSRAGVRDERRELVEVHERARPRARRSIVSPMEGLTPGQRVRRSPASRAPAAPTPARGGGASHVPERPLHQAARSSPP